MRIRLTAGFFLGAFFITFLPALVLASTVQTVVTEVHDVPCYDKHNNLIKGVTCEEEEIDYPNWFWPLFIFLNVSYAIFAILAFTLYIKKEEIIFGGKKR